METAALDEPFLVDLSCAELSFVVRFALLELFTIQVHQSFVAAKLETWTLL